MWLIEEDEKKMKIYIYFFILIVEVKFVIFEAV